MKRTLSASSVSSMEDDNEYQIDDTSSDQTSTQAAPSSPSRKTKAKAKTTPRPTKSPRKTKASTIIKLEASDSEDVPKSKPKPNPKDDSAPGEWTPEKREKVIDLIIGNGYKNTDLVALAAQLDLKPTQIKNQLSPGRKGNFRDKCVRCIRAGEMK